MRISFDFDSTLAEKRMQKVAVKFITDGHDVYITTSRMDHYEHEYAKRWNDDVYKVADQLGIARENVQFTNCDIKANYLKGFDMHFDDDIVEIQCIEQKVPECACILIMDP